MLTPGDLLRFFFGYFIVRGYCESGMKTEKLKMGVKYDLQSALDCLKC